VFHLGCCDPPLTEVPEGDFKCNQCAEESHNDECERCGKGSTDADGDPLMCDTQDCPFVSCVCKLLRTVEMPAVVAAAAATTVVDGGSGSSE
jgi:hypothetical protein